MQINWKIFDVSLIGPKHQVAQTPNQDNAIAVTLKHCDIIMVADGLGSHALSHIGSQAVCRAVIKACKAVDEQIENIDPSHFLRLVHTLWLVILQEKSLAQCGTTALIAIRTQNKIHLFALGDGMVAVLDKNYHTHFLLSHDKREFGNITQAMNEQFDESNWQKYEYPVDNTLMVMLCTDGIADDIQQDKKQQWILDFYQHYQHDTVKQISYDIKKWLKKWPVKHHHDDKSMACLLRECPMEQPE